MGEHTPTPWRFSPWHVEEGQSAVRTGQNYPEDYIICTTASDDDAKLIVTAVNNFHDLVVALQQALDRLEMIAQGRMPNATRFVPQIDAAIEHARVVLGRVGGAR